MPSEVPKSKFLGAAVLAVWIVAMLLLFWFFQFKYTTNWVSFQGSEFKELTMSVTRQATVVHFIDPDCPCTKFSAPHIERLELEWPNVEFKSMVRNVSTDLSLRLNMVVPASPAVAMWDQSGELTYFGPYTAGEICGEGEDLLGKALTSPAGGQWINQEAVGCFCPWSAGVEP